MEDSDSANDGAENDETTQFNVKNVPVADLERAKENTEFGGVSKGVREKIRKIGVGEPVTEAEAKNQLTSEQWEETESGIQDVLASLSDNASRGGAVSMDSVREQFGAFCREREDAIEKANAERIQRASSEVAERESDPESVSVGADKAPVEAAESLIKEDGTVPDAYLKEGPENLVVQERAEECGMEPEAFFEFVIDELDDSLLQVEGWGTRYDRQGTDTSRQSAATDGGESR